MCLESSEWYLQWEAARCLTGNLQAVGIWLHQVSHLYWSQGLQRNMQTLTCCIAWRINTLSLDVWITQMVKFYANYKKHK